MNLRLPTQRQVPIIVRVRWLNFMRPILSEDLVFDMNSLETRRPFTQSSRNVDVQESGEYQSYETRPFRDIQIERRSL